MCVRFFLESGIEELRQNYKVRYERLDKYSTGDFYPSQNAPVILEDKERTITLAKWGLNHGTKKGIVINARAETVMHKPMFEKAVRYSRCVIPANLFYEWQDQGTDKKVKYKICLQDSNIMSLGGIYKVSFDKDLKPHLSFVIITIEAEESVKEIHPRMPLIIKDELLDLWLNKDTSIKFVEEILKSKINTKFVVKRCEDESNKVVNNKRYEQMKMF